MHWLNYHHLLYFWTVAREGSVSAAAGRLGVSRPTVTGQVRRLEQTLGQRLFSREGRRLVLTDFGETVLRHAEAVFAAGEELQRTVRGGADAPRLVVGVPDVLPKLAVFRLLEPALRISNPPRLVCFEGKLDELLADLSLHRLDLVLSDAPLSSASSVRAFTHILGECGVSFFARPKIARKLRVDFPKSLTGAPMLLPVERTALRRLLDKWFDDFAIRPQIVGEFEDSALLKVFGQAGFGAFPAPSVIEREVIEQYDVELVGRLDAVRERFFAISLHRKLKHPAVLAITGAARDTLF
ncbi:MAG TPA: transcriptional activator NhaR [Lacipirellulaceae bacterium]|nr:transcriptional activator NhaR [Lacipirellulaceae bacterium]